MSFVYDIADLYKEEFIIPTAFKVAASYGEDIDTMRLFCRKSFADSHLMNRIAKDLKSLFDFPDINAKTPTQVGLWDLETYVELGVNYAK